MGGICNHFQSLRGHGARALGGDYGTDRNVSEGLLYLSLSIDFFWNTTQTFDIVAFELYTKTVLMFDPDYTLTTQCKQSRLLCSVRRDKVN